MPPPLKTYLFNGPIWIPSAQAYTRADVMVDFGPPTSSSPSTEIRIVPRRRFQNGRVYKRGVKWVGSYREREINPQTGKRTRRTVTFGSGVTSERAARSALQPYLDRVNIAALPAPRKAGKTLCELIDEWKEKIIPNRKDGGARASLSHIRTYIAPQLGETPLHELNLSMHQAFVTAVGRRASRRKTVGGAMSSPMSDGKTLSSPLTRRPKHKFSSSMQILRRESSTLPCSHSSSCA